jgi:hypothetical protein
VIHWNNGWIGILLGLALGVLALFLLPLKRIRRRHRRLATLRGYYILTVAAYPVFVLIYSLNGAFWAAFVVGYATFPLSYLIAAFIEAMGLSRVARKRNSRLHHAYAAAALAMLDTAVRVSRNRGKWQSSAVSRSLIDEVEFLARTIQRHLALKDRTGSLHPDVSSQTASEAQRVAYMVRQHKKLIACASGVSDFVEVASSFTNAARALLANNRSKLLEGAPEVALRRRVKDALRYVFPAILLLIAALTLPLIPLISEQEKVADGVRVTLIVAGVLALIAPRSESAAKILDVLGNAMSPK